MPATREELSLTEVEINQLRRFVLYLHNPGVRAQIVKVMVEGDVRLTYIEAGQIYDSLRASLAEAVTPILSDSNLLDVLIKAAPELQSLQEYAQTYANKAGSTRVIMQQVIPADTVIIALVDCFHSHVIERAAQLKLKVG